LDHEIYHEPVTTSKIKRERKVKKMGGKIRFSLFLNRERTGYIAGGTANALHADDEVKEISSCI
jgi:hypothetical protein